MLIRFLLYLLNIVILLLHIVILWLLHIIPPFLCFLIIQIKGQESRIKGVICYTDYKGH